jgi:hypothetical protein
MRTNRRSFCITAVIAIGLVAALPATVVGAGRAGASSSPNPDVQKKVWTNDDFRAAGASQAANSAELASAALVTESPAGQEGASAPAPLNPEQDPRFYILQMASLENELASVEGEVRQLRNFRTTGTGIQPGLQLYAPCMGVGTDNLIAELDARRRDILDRMDAVSDTARRNNMPPGILRNAGDRAAELETPLTADERQDMLKAQARDFALQLDQTRGTLQASYAQAQSQGITLGQPPANVGGNMTTNMLRDLHGRAQALQSEIGQIEDQARHEGIAPGLLP